ncbi:MAG TPA: protocatechuate 3,4-dioxygenase subunit alpha, partial [Candidatus Dormibacteraeota bacterium]|nr:protocatechuate 3,4-dioxygenase subunit alpha [Candidatus Dormibacteraeota bacterium]
MIPTPSQTVGPFFGFALTPIEHPGDAIRVEGQVLDGAGAAVSDALLEVSDGEHFARCRADEEGAFHFFACRAPFLTITVFARGLLRHLNTRMYFPGDEAAVPA